MKKPGSRPRITLPFDYMPPIPEDQLAQVRRLLTEAVNGMHSRRSFITSIQAELIRHLVYSSRLNFEVFSEIYSRLKSDFDAFFSNLPAPTLFRFFDEDCDSYMNEDEQLLLLTVLLSRFYHLLEEVNFYSLYDLDPLLRGLIASCIDATIALEKSLRNKFFQDQNQKFDKYKTSKLAQIESGNRSQLHRFEAMRATKQAEFGAFQDTEEREVLSRFRRKKSLFNFNKYADLRNFLMQEKLLGLAGRHEEAKNTFRNYNWFLERELGHVQTNVEGAFRQASQNFQKKCTFKRSVLENKIVAEKEKIRCQQREKQLLLDKNLNVLENKLRIQQDQSTAQSAFTFLKSCKINLLKSENALKKDFTMKINSNLKSIFQQEVIHSHVFKSVFQKGKLSIISGKSEAAALESLKEAKDSQFNVRLSLRNLDDRPMPVNSKVRMGTKTRLNNSISRVLVDEGLPLVDNSGLRLTMLYDDNLNEITGA